MARKKMDKSVRVNKRRGGTASGRTAADRPSMAGTGHSAARYGVRRQAAAARRPHVDPGPPMAQWKGKRGGTAGGRTAADSAKAAQAGSTSRGKGLAKWGAALTRGGRRRGMQEGGLAGGSLSDLGFGGGAPDIQPDLSGVAEAIGRMPSEVDMAYEVPMYGEYGDPSMTGGRTEGYIPRHPGNALGSQNAPLGGRKLMQEPRGMRHGGMATMPSRNTTVRGPHGGTATSKNTNQHKLNAMGKLKGQ